MSEAKAHADTREFGADDALAIARNIVEVGRDAHAHFSEAAVSMIAGIILWEALKASTRDDPAIADRVSGVLSETDETDSLKSTLEAATSWITASTRDDPL